MAIADVEEEEEEVTGDDSDDDVDVEDDEEEESGTPRLTTTAAVPAALASWPPLPGKISTLWTCVPTGMSLRGSEHPGSTGEPRPAETTSPGETPAGARM